MTSRQLPTLGTDGFRVAPWHADTRVAYLAVRAPTRELSVEGLNGCLRRIDAAGFRSVVTSAMHPEEAGSFLDAGFEEHDRLLVLSHDLADLAARSPALPPGTRLRRARRRDRSEALDVDARAFSEFWRLDRTAMSEAERATPVSRFRVAVTAGRVSGYAITGRGNRQAFLQRLATDPADGGHGIGTALVLDALRWARRRHCRRLLVNTQRSNDRAIDLYRRVGFTSTSTDLVVLSRRLP